MTGSHEVRSSILLGSTIEHTVPQGSLKTNPWGMLLFRTFRSQAGRSAGIVLDLLGCVAQAGACVYHGGRGEREGQADEVSVLRA